MSSQRAQPSLPPDSVYTSCYCEENIYLLAQAFAQQADTDIDCPWNAFVVFISNRRKTVALWSQKAREGVVVWDYHVILVLRPRGHAQKTKQDPEYRDDGKRAGASGEAWVYDFDTRLPVPSRWTGYLSDTFPYVLNKGLSIAPDYQSLFRVVRSAAHLDHFASDRSHMLRDSSDDTPCYATAPPSYPILCGRKAKESGATNNLMEAYVWMGLHEPLSKPAVPQAHRATDDASAYGSVMCMSEFVRWLSGENGADP